MLSNFKFCWIIFRMPGQANITKFFRPIATSSVAAKTENSKSSTLKKEETETENTKPSTSNQEEIENRSPNESLELKTPEKIIGEGMEVKKRKLENKDDSEQSHKSCMTPGTYCGLVRLG